MKSWKRAVAVALCAASLLAGCGGDCGLSDDDSADEPQITVEQLRAANDQRSLLEKHDAVTVTVRSLPCHFRRKLPPPRPVRDPGLLGRAEPGH